jgi:hypothetical protein
MTTISSHALHPRTPQAIKASRSWSIRALEVAGSAMEESPSDPACGACAQAKSVAFYNLGMLSEVRGTLAANPDHNHLDWPVAQHGRLADEVASDGRRFCGCAPAVQVRGGECQGHRVQRGATRSRTGHQQGTKLQRGCPECNRGKEWSPVIEEKLDFSQGLYEEMEDVIYTLCVECGVLVYPICTTGNSVRKCPLDPRRPLSSAREIRRQKRPWLVGTEGRRTCSPSTQR